MALNPPINSDGQPMRVEGEYFAVLRKNMEIEVKVEGWSKLSAKGKVSILSNSLSLIPFSIAFCYHRQTCLC